MRRAAAAMIVGAMLATACGAEEQSGARSTGPTSELDRIERSTDGPVYWLGPSFEGLRLTHAEGARPAPAAAPPASTRPSRIPRPVAPAPGPLLVYGECNGEGEGDSWRCTGPQVQLQHWPLDSPSRYPRHFSCTRTTIRGVPAAQFTDLELYTGRLLIRIFASHDQARRAAAALRPVGETASPRGSLPPPVSDLSEALRRCALDSLDAKLDELRDHARIPLLWAGRRLDGHPLFRAEGDGSWARFLYGGCDTPEVAGSCWPPVTVEVTPNDESRPSGWARSVRCHRATLRGAPAATMPSASALFVFTGAVTVHLHGRDPTLVRRAAEALHSLDGPATAEDLPRPAAEIADELGARCSR